MCIIVKRNAQVMRAKVNEVVRQRISVTLPEECIDWLDRQVEARKYYNRSHAIESLILEKMTGKKERGSEEREEP
jgi:Arc/MetJ-type ribon-helix-helix transcriptional regulator